ncbi:hypothetical protein TESS_TESS_02808 [Tessaracoccus sp. O5.2]
MHSDQAARDIRNAKVEHISDQAQRAKSGQIEDAFQTAQYHDALQQEADITAGHRILRYSGLIAVSAPTVEPDLAHLVPIVRGRRAGYRRWWIRSKSWVTLSGRGSSAVTVWSPAWMSMVR